MKLIISGSRRYYIYPEFDKVVKNFLKKLKLENPDLTRDDFEIVAGEARGIDSLAKLFCDKYGYNYKGFPANWVENGKIAGMIRNKEMLNYCLDDEDIYLLAFLDSESVGTKNMIEICNTSKMVGVFVVDLENSPLTYL